MGQRVASWSAGDPCQVQVKTLARPRRSRPRLACYPLFRTTGIAIQGDKA
jgi:hypothetical protein